MMKTPGGDNALLILRTHHEHETQKVYKNFIRFSPGIGGCPNDDKKKGGAAE